MRNRILCIALALSLLAVVFTALPTSAAVHYTGSVETTDYTGAPKDLFNQGEYVYVNVELNYDGLPYVGEIQVRLERLDGSSVSSFTDYTDDPVVGWLNGSVSVPNRYLYTGAWFDGDRTVYNVVVYVDNGWYWEEYTRTQVVVLKEGLTLMPWPSPYYYPGLDVTMTYVTSHTTEVFYIQVVNETGYAEENWTGLVALDGWYQRVWSIASDMPDGGYYINVRSASTHAIWESVWFQVQKYVLEVDSDRDYYLPGETASMSYIVYETATLQPYTGVNIFWSMSYTNASGGAVSTNYTALPALTGTQEIVIPTDIALYDDILVTYYANETGRSFYTGLWLNLGQIMAMAEIDDGPYFVPGDMVVIEVTATLSGYDYLPGASVEISVERNGTLIAAYGSTNLTTDLSGRVTHTIMLAEEAAMGTYLVTVTVSKVGYEATAMTLFHVEWYGWLVVEFDKEYYYSGDSATMSFRGVWNNLEIDVPAISYIVYVGGGVLTTGNTSGDDVSITLPSNYFGWVSVSAAANIDGYILYGWDYADIYLADLVLTVMTTGYRPGETLVWNWQIVTGLQSGYLTYSIYDSYGVRVATGNPTFALSGSIEYDVPAEDASEYYTCEMRMISGTGGYVFDEATAYITQAYDLSIWVGKSSYASGAFAPGDKVTVHYEINSYLGDDLPVYRLVLSTSYVDEDIVALVTEPRGDIEIEIPDDAPFGWFWIDAWIYDAVTGDYLSYDDTMFAVDNQLSAWDKSVGGMSAIDFTILVLIVVMILLLIIVPFLKGKGMMPKKEEKPVETPPPPPASPPPTT